jgi:hypothetical protein
MRSLQAVAAIGPSTFNPIDLVDQGARPRWQGSLVTACILKLTPRLHV